MNLQESIRRILRENMESKPNKRVYDYDKERDTVPERLPFDINKLVNSGVVFVTPAIDGDPDSETYKEWLEEPYTHLLSLYNVEHSSEDGWIKKAITKVAPTEQYKNFVDKMYDGKYNQILWGLEKLGINPMDMLIDTNLQENIRRILREDRQPSNFLKRRFKMLDYEVEYYFYEIEHRIGTYSGIDICVIYENGVRLFETIMENAIYAMYYNYFSHIDDNSGEWAHEYLDMVNYIRNKYQDKIIKYYKDNCGSGLIPLKESIKKVLKEESTQDSSYEIIITENQQDSLKIELQSMVKDIGWESTSKIVNGPKKLVKLAFNNDPMEFLNLFNDLNVVQSREEFYWSLFRYKKRNNLMIYNTKNNTLYISKKIFTSFLDEGFGLSYSKMEELIRIWLYDTYNLRGDRTFEMMQIFDWEKSSLSRIG